MPCPDLLSLSVALRITLGVVGASARTVCCPAPACARVRVRRVPVSRPPAIDARDALAVKRAVCALTAVRCPLSTCDMCNWNCVTKRLITLNSD